MVVVIVAAAAAAVDGGDDVDVEDGCVDGVVGTVVVAAAVAGIVDFDAFRALAVVVVAAAVDLDSSCLPVMLAMEAWFARDTKASYRWLKSLLPWGRRKRSEACPDRTVRHYLQGRHSAAGLVEAFANWARSCR